MKPFRFLYIIIFLVLLTAHACKKDPVIPNQEELITTLIYTLTPKGGGQAVTLSFRDTDGEGGVAPVIETDTLMAETTYSGSLELLNESVTPVINITQEIENEAQDHQFFFGTSTLAPVLITYADTDDSGFPVGLTTSATTSTPGNGQLTIRLVHKPDKNALWVSVGDPSNAGGETDIEVTFPVVIQ